MPHPRVSLWFVPLMFFLRMLPGLALLLATFAFFVGLIQVLVSNQQVLFQFMLLGLFIGFLWWLYLKLPRFIRRGLSRLFGRSERNGHER